MIHPKKPFRLRQSLRENRAGLALAFLALCYVGYAGWLDMNPDYSSKAPSQTRARYEAGYFIKDDNAFARLPGDTKPVFFHAGRLSAEQGTETHISPVNAPHREINAVLFMDNLPAEPETIYAAQDSLLAPWKRKNNTIFEVVLAYETEKPDLPALEKLLGTMDDNMARPYRTGLVLQRRWLENDKAARGQLANAAKYTRSLIFTLDESAREGESLEQTIAALDEYKLWFMLQTESLPDRDVMARLEAAQHKFFQGFLITPPSAANP